MERSRNTPLKALTRCETADINGSGVDWREEFLKSLSFELATVYSEQLIKKHSEI